MKAADGAENVKMLYERQLELEKLLVNVKDDKEKLNLLKESDMLPRVLRLFLREKRRLLRQ